MPDIALADYGYLIDWNGDGLFGHALSDVSAYVLKSSWSGGIPNGAPEHPNAGTCAMTLDNSSSIFSSENSASPLYGCIRPGLLLRITMTIGGGSPATMFQGYLQSLVPTVNLAPEGRINTAELTGLGIISQWSDSGALQAEVDVPLQEDVTTGDAIGQLLDQDGFPSGSRAIDGGQSTLSKWWIRKGTSRLQAILDLVDHELGRLREGKDGKLVFEDRAHPFTAPRSSAVQAIYGTGLLNLWNLKQMDSLPGIFNLVQANVHTFNQSEDIILVVLADLAAGSGGGNPLVVPAHGSLTVWFEYPTSSSPGNYISVAGWSMVDYEGNTAKDGTGTDITSDVSAVKTSYGPRQKVVFSNANGSDAYLVTLRAHGVAVVEGDALPIKSEDATSQGKYRKRAYPYPPLWETSQADGQAKLDYVKSIYKDPRPRLQFDVKGNYDAAHLAEVQQRDVSDRIRVDASVADFGLGIDAGMLVDHIAHQVDEARLHTMTMTCTLAPATQLSADGTAYAPKTVVPPSTGVNPVPDRITTRSVLLVDNIAFGCYAKKWNAGIDQAELRARLILIGESAEVVDLRTPAEGGTLVHDGTTQLIVTGLGTSALGEAYHQFYFGSNRGKWFYAFRMRNAAGWSVWSDGNDTPQKARDFVDTESGALTDTGPPADWTVQVVAGAQAGTAQAIATRPKTNAKRLFNVFFQMRDTRGGGQWREVDENAGASVVYYDGSGRDHTYDPATGILSRDDGLAFGVSKTACSYGTFARARSTGNIADGRRWPPARSSRTN